MPDLLDSIRKELHARVTELRPLVSEYERLQEAERALTDGSPRRPASGRRAGPTGSASRPGASRSAARRPSTPAAPAATQERILAVVGERPGIGKSELKHVTGLSGAGVAQNLRRMIGRGELLEERLPAGEVGYRLGGGEPVAERAADEQAGESVSGKRPARGRGRGQSTSAAHASASGTEKKPGARAGKPATAKSRAARKGQGRSAAKAPAATTADPTGASASATAADRKDLDGDGDATGDATQEATRER
jgi:hypothetical protein